MAGVGEPSITPGTVLAGTTITSLCRARDFGVAAATGDPFNPPDNLRGIDPARWPQLVVEGRQAVTDLVTSVIPMVYAQTRHVLHAADVQGQMFVELMGAAYRFDPQRTAPERWPTYAWMSLEHVRRHGVDQAGVARNYSRRPQATLVTFGEIEPASREPGPGATIEERQATEAIKQALGRLPHSLQGPLLESIQGRPERVIAEEGGFSESTARRRILEARETLRRDLATHADDADDGPYETVTDPVLERSQHMFDETLATSHANIGGPHTDEAPLCLTGDARSRGRAPSHDPQPVAAPGAYPKHSNSCAYPSDLRGWQRKAEGDLSIVGVEDGLMLIAGEAVVSSRIRSDFGLLGERVRRRPTHCLVDEVHPGIVLSWSSSSSGWMALVAYGDESGVLHVGPLPAARLRPV